MNHTLQLHTHNPNDTYLIAYCTTCSQAREIRTDSTEYSPIWYINEWWQQHLQNTTSTPAPNYHIGS